MKKSLFLGDVNLQRFASNEEATDTNQDEQSPGDIGADDANNDESIADNYITREQYEEDLKAELKRQREELMKNFAKEKADELRKSKLSEAEKKEEEHKELLEKLDKISEENRLMKLENETSKLLEKEGLPQKYLGFLMGKDSETTAENIKHFKEQYQADIKNAKEEQWKNDAPEAPLNDLSSEDHAFKVATDNYNK